MLFGKPPHTDPITATPVHVGILGKVWEKPLPPEAATQPHASVAGWVVEAPWAHGLWHSYFVYVIHLRDVPGLDGKLKMYRADATHEFGIWAMDPDKPRQAFLDNKLDGALLSPINFSAQIVCTSDDNARETIMSALRDICAGTLSPDTDYISVWAGRFGGHMLKGHPDNPLTQRRDATVQ